MKPPYYPGNLSGNDRRYNRNQNTYDSGLTNKGPGMYRRNGMHRKKPGSDSDTIVSDGITAIKDYLKEITDLQKRLVDSQEQIARAQETHAAAMQQIANCVMLLLGKGTDPASATDEKPAHATEPEVFQEMPTIETPVESSPEASLAEETSRDEASSEAIAAEPMVEDASSEEIAAGSIVEAALKIIAEMRGNRISFEKIADHLETEGFPPVSGMGKWNRKTVSKFFKEATV